MSKPKKSSGMDIALAIIMMLVMISGFTLVYAIDMYDNGNQENIIVFQSDSSITHSILTIGNPIINQPTTQQNAYYYSSGGYVFGWNKTAVYNGNNTWLLTCNGTSATPSSSALNYQVTIPNLDSFIIDNISLTLHIDSPDTDIRYSTAILYDVSGVYDIALPPNERQSPSLKTFTDSSFDINYPDGWFNTTITPSLSTALQIYDIMQEKTNGHFIIAIGDLNLDGLSQFTLTIGIEIGGKQIGGWDTVTQVKWAIGSTAILGIITGIFMLDQYDLGGYTRDLPKRKTKPKTKSKKSKGGK